MSEQTDLRTGPTVATESRPSTPGWITEKLQTPDGSWRRWLLWFAALSAAFSVTTYLALVLIDPFSTGRFALTQRIDFASTNPRLSKAGLVRDKRFNAAIIGSSSAFPLDPMRIMEGTPWRAAQLSIPAALPADQLLVARAFERHRSDMRLFRLFVLDSRWCDAHRPDANPWGPFPAWIYESSDGEYLGRIFSMPSIESMTRRVTLWLGLTRQTSRSDGHAPTFPRKGPAEIEAMNQTRRPADGGPTPKEPYPAIDAIASHVASISQDGAVFFLFAPTHISAIPVPGSIADERLTTCKSKIRAIAESYPISGMLDLKTDNALSRDTDAYFDPIHFSLRIARLVEDEVAAALRRVSASWR